MQGNIWLWLPSIILPAFSLALCGILAKRGKGAYTAYTENLDKKEWSLRDYLHIGFAWCALGPEKKLPKAAAEPWNRYRHGIYGKVLLLYGKYRGAEQMYYVYEANKATLGIFALAGISVFAPLAAAANSDLSLAYKLDIAAVAAGLGIPFLMDWSLDGKLKERESALLLQFPTFGSKLVLLLRAGMTVPKSIRKIVADNKENTVLMTELSEMLRSIEAGMAETAAYEEFARRCHVKEINRFISVLVQSMQKGGQELSLTLSLQVQECWNARKDMAVTLGQQASTKLVAPLMLMMLAIIMMVGGPALLMFSKM